MDLGNNLHEHVGNLFFFVTKNGNFGVSFQICQRKIQGMVISKCKSEENRSQAHKKLGIVDF